MGTRIPHSILAHDSLAIEIDTLFPDTENCVEFRVWCYKYTFFYKKLGSGHRTKSFLISHEILSISVQKVS